MTCSFYEVFSGLSQNILSSKMKGYIKFSVFEIFHPDEIKENGYIRLGHWL